jgi:hypothetical protein
MTTCPLCFEDKLVTKQSSKGDETYCSGCRNIIASATLGFVFVAADDQNIQECKTADGLPGYKGPGKRARCYAYDESNEESKKAAMEKARNSAYSSQRKAKVASIVNALDYFGGNPLNVSGDTASTGVGAGTATINPVEPFGQATTIGMGTTNSATPVPAAPGGIQMGELNGANPLNSATTGRKKVAELLEEFDRTKPYITEYMGPAICAIHGIVDGCKSDSEA